MDDTKALRDALLAAYAPHVAAGVAALGVPETPGLAEAIAEGERWLADALDDLLGRPFAEQRRTPLEVFQEAVRFPTEALDAAGVSPITRDEAAEAALPGDRYGLAPASSQELGEHAWQAHLAWGSAKAIAMTRPVVGLLSTDLMDRSRVESAAGPAGFAVATWPSLDAATAGRLPPVAFVDLAHGDADAAVRVLSEAGVRVVCFGSHVDDMAMTRARSLGAADTLPRSRFFRSIPELLPTIA
jgi:hypothetical protein